VNLTPRQTEIVQVAVKLVADKGIQNLTIKNLATEIGISEPALYRHFENKLAILKAVIDAFENLMQPALNKLKERSVANKKIELFIREHFNILSNNPYFAKVIFSESNFQNQPALISAVTQMMNSSRQKLEAIILEGQQNNQIRTDISSTNFARIIIGSMRFLITQWNLSGELFNLENEGRKLIEEIGILLKK
jgi:AcrR family transcriptional regulator